MGIRSFELSAEQRAYFNDVDNSILHQSVELGRVELQAEALKSSLGTLYAARQKQLYAVLADVGIDLSNCGGVRVENGSLVCQTQDPDLADQDVPPVVSGPA